MGFRRHLVEHQKQSAIARKENTMKKITWKVKSLFDSAAMAGRIMGSDCAKIISRQPGYRRGQTMSIFKTTGGAYRLYALINGQWMDASLYDLPEAAQ
jgi:hypothetical protein